MRQAERPLFRQTVGETDKFQASSCSALDCSSVHLYCTWTHDYVHDALADNLAEGANATGKVLFAKYPGSCGWLMREITILRMYWPVTTC
jgi:hypothetical protein